MRHACPSSLGLGCRRARLSRGYGIHARRNASSDASGVGCLSLLAQDLPGGNADTRSRTEPTLPPGHKESPAERGFLKCAREDSNLHGPYSPQGPQPCASTNSATGAGGGQYSPAPCCAGRRRAPAEVAEPVLRCSGGAAIESVLRPRYSSEHMFDCVRIAERTEQGAD